MMSGSTILKNSAQLCADKQKQTWIKRNDQEKSQQSIMYSSAVTCSNLFSCVKHKICEPTILAQDWRVNTVRMKGSVSPCRCTMEAIWITGSLSASGKIPGTQQVITGGWHGIKSVHTNQISFTHSTAVSCKFHRKVQTFPSGTLNIKAKDSEGRNSLPFSLCWVAYEIGPSNIHLILTQGHLKEKK